MGASQRAAAASTACRRSSRGVVARALAKDPADRFPSAGDLGRAALAAAGRSARRGPSATSRAERRRRRAPPQTAATRARAARRRTTARPTSRRPTATTPRPRRAARRGRIGAPAGAPALLAGRASLALAVARSPRWRCSAAATTPPDGGRRARRPPTAAPRAPRPPRRRPRRARSRRGPTAHGRRRAGVGAEPLGRQRSSSLDAKTGEPRRRVPHSGPAAQRVDRRLRLGLGDQERLTGALLRFDAEDAAARGRGDVEIARRAAPSAIADGRGRGVGRRAQARPARPHRASRSCASTRAPSSPRRIDRRRPTACRTSRSARARSG